MSRSVSPPLEVLPKILLMRDIHTCDIFCHFKVPLMVISFRTDALHHLLIIQEDLQPSSRIHGPNQWPSQLPAFEATTRAYVQRMLGLGHALMRGGGAVC
jgi:hypothetical protein